MAWNRPVNHSVNAPVRALVLAGGGARGSYQVGVWRALTELGWRVYPSQTNFVFVDTGREAAPLADAARAAGFIIRAGAGWGYPGFLRISLGTPEQNAALVEVIKKVVDAAGKSTTSAN